MQPCSNTFRRFQNTFKSVQTCAKYTQQQQTCAKACRILKKTKENNQNNKARKTYIQNLQKSIEVDDVQTFQ